MIRRHGVLLAFVACTLAVVGAMAWLTWHALRMERNERKARDAALYQDTLRVALWRMDSVVSAIMAREVARPYFEYQAFYPADRAYTRMWEEVRPGDVLVPSSLLRQHASFVRLHFQWSMRDGWTSPQAPSGNMRDMAESTYCTSNEVMRAQQDLDRLRECFVSSGASFRVSELSLSDDVSDRGPWIGGLMTTLATDARLDTQVDTPTAEQSFGSSEPTTFAKEDFARRSAAANIINERQQAYSPSASRVESSRAVAGTRASPGVPVSDQVGVLTKAEHARLAAVMENASDDVASLALTQLQAKDVLSLGGDTLEDSASVAVGMFRPAWLSGAGDEASELVFTRDVRKQDAYVAQGFWIDWPTLRADLVSRVDDLFSEVELVPDPLRTADLAHRMATIDAALVATPRKRLMPVSASWTPLETGLVLAWIAVVGAVGAIALVLRTSTELAERRGRFVSAVTHELRTPLTTFCMYSQMLADGMVPEGEQTREYVRTLKGESKRLADIVESVLEYARLGRRRVAGRVTHEAITVNELLERLEEPLRRRAEQCSMELVVERSGPGTASVRAEPGTIERILANLLDNSCKYAKGATDRRVHLRVLVGGGDLKMIVSDHGPGIESGERTKIFRAFVRGEAQSSGTVSGLGLGLALSRGLADDLGGSLRLTEPSRAEFTLTVPLASK